ncbi:MAG TPA: glycosyltransferase family 39 protein, partial [Magnetospirillum sp.]|nr:glycosyltransferase family 39 protein [Magnetospirillum sp.]
MTVRPSAEKLALWLLPVAFVAVLFVMRGSSLPFWQSFNLDPDYYYLLNGLRIIEGMAPTDISHPGTPVQVLIAVVMKALHPLASPEAIVDAVLADAEGTLRAVTTVIYLLVGLSLWWMGRALFASTGALLPALLAQTAPLLSRIVPKFALHPKPEPFLIIATALLVGALAPLLRPRTDSGDRRAEDWAAALAGIAMALGVACKIHFAVLGVIPLLLLDRRRLGIYLGVGAAALLVFVAPAIPSWDIWVDWIKRM